MTNLSVSQMMRNAKKFEQRAQYGQARELYQNILASYPGNVRARQGLQNLPKVDPSITQFKTPQSQVVELIQLLESRKYSKAIRMAEKIASREPGLGLAWKVIGMANEKLEKFAEAEIGFRKALEVEPNCFETHNNLGVVLKEQNKLNEAVSSYQRSAHCNPKYFRAQFNLGIALKEQSQLDEAISAFQRAILLNPDHAQSHFNLGQSYFEREDNDKALESYQIAIKLQPNYAEAHDGLGMIYQTLGDYTLAAKQHNQAVLIKPDFARAHYNLGCCYTRFQNFPESASSFDLACRHDPGEITYHIGKAKALNKLHQFKSAISAAEKALKLDGASSDARKLLSTAYLSMKDFERSRSMAEQQLNVDPNSKWALRRIGKIRRETSDWPSLSESETGDDLFGEDDRSIAPFALLFSIDDPQRQMQRSRYWARKNFKRPALALPPSPVSRPKKLRIGYFSADFHNHATLYLMSGLIRQHDKKRFEIYAYSYGKVQSGEMRDKLSADVDCFTDIRAVSDNDVVNLAREHHLDIAICLTGYTSGSRVRLFANRLAPIQINYLGYPCTLGADFMDYIVADPIVIPDDQRQYYSEKVIRLPNSYQPNDNQRAIAQTATQRSDFDLPENGFVFCCFNNNARIKSKEFDIWMRVLEKVEGSVLWLIRWNKLAEENLHRQALARGVDPQRLVFADQLSHPEHLARLRHADLFIDTFNYNAHTTASDALWAGVPVVTKVGRQFAARVAGSLLNAVGMPELITESEQEYEDLILELACDPNKLKAVKDKLREIGPTSALYDTERYTRDFETALDMAYQLYLDGKSPAHIDLC